MFGYKSNEIIGHESIEILSPNQKSKDILKNIFQSVCETGEGETCKVKKKTKDGDEVLVNIAISPRFNNLGKRE